MMKRPPGLGGRRDGCCEAEGDGGVTAWNHWKMSGGRGGEIRGEGAAGYQDRNRRKIQGR
jgi:hypothetical protein